MAGGTKEDVRNPEWQPPPQICPAAVTELQPSALPASLAARCGHARSSHQWNVSRNDLCQSWDSMELLQILFPFP